MELIKAVPKVLFTIKKKIIEIGDWDMDATTSITVAHGLGSNFTKIRSVSVMIIRDDSSVISKLDGDVSAGDGGTTEMQGAIRTINSTVINLLRLTGGVYDNVNYNSTPFNRGHITIEFEA